MFFYRAEQSRRRIRYMSGYDLEPEEVLIYPV